MHQIRCTASNGAPFSRPDSAQGDQLHADAVRPPTTTESGDAMLDIDLGAREGRSKSDGRTCRRSRSVASGQNVEASAEKLQLNP